MTPFYVLDVLSRRGIKEAIKVAEATQDPRLLKVVLVSSFERTGIARPIEVMGRNKRGKQIVLRVVEGCTPVQLEAIRDEIARTRSKSKKSAVKYGTQLTAEELARRAAVVRKAA